MASQPTSNQNPFSWDIDTYLNRIVPRPRLHLLPRPISHFLGYRETPMRQISQPLIWFWSFFGAFLGVLITSLFFRIPHLVSLTSSTYNPDDPSSAVTTELIIVASLGATAILEYNAISSPLAQPRNAILGQGLSAFIGIAIIRLFGLMHNAEKLESLRWVAGALAVGASSAVMGVTKTVHPPAGATALLAVTSPQVRDLGWLLIPVIMAASAIMIVVALLVNNIQRQFPMWWWTEIPLTPTKRDCDIEKAVNAAKLDVSSIRSSESGDSQKAISRHVEGSRLVEPEDTIRIDAYSIRVPEYLQLSTEEQAFLEMLKHKFVSR